jgi:hydrogenase nickel incorporation protein HypB
MSAFRILEIKASVFDHNNHDANTLRQELSARGIYLLNLMASPGAGKTTTLVQLIQHLKSDYRIGVMEADIDSDVDAQTIAATGVKVIQLHTGGMCHLDAEMTRQGLHGLGIDDLDLVILENVGNLVCPAEFDTGAVKNAMILSVPEGDDKPLKYPLMFEVSSVMLINKIDVLEHFDFDVERCTARAKVHNPTIQVMPISARTGQGIEAFAEWIRQEVKAWKGKTYA